MFVKNTPNILNQSSKNMTTFDSVGNIILFKKKKTALNDFNSCLTS